MQPQAAGAGMPWSPLLRTALVLLALSCHVTPGRGKTLARPLAGYADAGAARGPEDASSSVAATAGSNDYVNQLLVTMRDPSPSTPPPPRHRKHHKQPSTKAAPPVNQAVAAQQPLPPQAQGDGERVECPRGIICAQPGSKICGDSVCGPTDRCIDFSCCSKDSPICNGRCCPSGHSCLGSPGQCAPPGARLCGASVCLPGNTCFNMGAAGGPVALPPAGSSSGSGAAGAAAAGPLVCCTDKPQLCGSSCCAKGEVCLGGRCRPAGSSVCGALGLVCGPREVCAGNVACCPAGASLCGGACCAAGAECAGGRCVAPLAKGSSPCGTTGLVCTPQQVCLQAMQTGGGAAVASTVAACCPPGAQLCGTGCCNVGTGGQQCVLANGAPVCVGVGAGSTLCGGRVCGPNQRCAERPSPQCCGAGDALCAGACCPAAKRCVSGMCVASNALVCGAVVCAQNQVCIGNAFAPLCCGPNDVVCGGACCPAGRCNAQANRCGPATAPPPAPAPAPRGMLLL